VADAETLKKARKLHQDLFSNLPPEDQDGLVASMRSRLAGWQSELKGFAPLAASKHHPGLAVIDGATTLIGKQLAIADSFEFVDALVKGRDAWLDLADDAHDVTSFYKTQRPTWQRLLDALERYADNRDALEKDIKAAVALGTLESIRDNPTPWSVVSQIEPLIATVDAINEALAQGKREHALLSIDAKIAEVEQALDAAHADAPLRNRALLKLQEFKTKLAGLTSIPKIFYLQDQAGDALDIAMGMINAATPVVQPARAAENGAKDTAIKTTPAAVAPKPSKLLRPAELAGKTYLETEDEVDAYLTRLKGELLKAIQAGQRVRLQ
jgi:hypothetical protein